jgi:uncharacterized protein YijF (DUF1287 family)
MIRAAISTREFSVQLDRRFHYKAKKEWNKYTNSLDVKLPKSNFSTVFTEFSFCQISK